jgi:hypothetical protein
MIVGYRCIFFRFSEICRHHELADALLDRVYHLRYNSRYVPVRWRRRHPNQRFRGEQTSVGLERTKRQ